MPSVLPSLTVPVIPRNLCLSDKNRSSLGSVVTTLSRPLHVDILWNIFTPTSNIRRLSSLSVSFHICMPCLFLPFVRTSERLAACLSPHCAHRHNWQSGDDVPIWVGP